MEGVKNKGGRGNEKSTKAIEKSIIHGTCIHDGRGYALRLWCGTKYCTRYGSSAGHSNGGTGGHPEQYRSEKLFTVCGRDTAAGV